MNSNSYLIFIDKRFRIDFILATLILNISSFNKLSGIPGKFQQVKQYNFVFK